MKKIISLVLTAVICLTLGGCAFGGRKTALVVSGAEVDTEIYNYYLDLVEQRPRDYGLTDKSGSGDRRDKAVELCRKYVAFNTVFAERGLSLTNSEKLEIADNVNNFWSMSAEHYKDIGVSRVTLNKIFTEQAYEDTLFEADFDKGMDDSEAESAVKAFFYSNYTAFRNICEYFTASDGSKVSEQEKQNITNKFSEIAASSGSSYDDFTNTCAAAGYTASGTVILKKDSGGYPEGFFLKVYTMAPGTVGIFTYDDCIFCIRKENLSDLGEEVYYNYRSTCIRNMYEESWQEAVENYLSGFTVDEVKIK